jgi:hypothetical protein
VKGKPEGGARPMLLESYRRARNILAEQPAFPSGEPYSFCALWPSDRAAVL